MSATTLVLLAETCWIPNWGDSANTPDDGVTYQPGTCQLSSSVANVALNLSTNSVLSVSLPSDSRDWLVPSLAP